MTYVTFQGFRRLPYGTLTPAFAALVALGCSGSGGAASPAKHSADAVVDSDVSVTFVAPSDHEIGAVVSVTLGDAAPLDFVLDTGSSGLRVLSSAVDPSAFDSITSTPDEETFSDGQVFDGVVATARVGLGSAVTPTAISVQLVESVSCTNAKPSCPALPSGVAGILGIGMRSSSEAIGSPIVQMAGRPAYVIEAPPPVTAPGLAMGTLRIGPTEAEMAAFTKIPLAPGTKPALPNGTPSWLDDAVPVCVSDEMLGSSWCANGLLDTGGGAITVESTSVDTAATLSEGAHVQVSIGDDDVSSFAVSAEPAVGQDLVEVAPAASSNSINLGMFPFFHYAVLFDAQSGVVGLKARAS